MRRRELLQGLGTIALSQLVLGCQPTSPTALQVYLLQNALPPQLLGKARSTAKEAPSLMLKAEISSLFEQLELWQGKREIPWLSKLSEQLQFWRRQPSLLSPRLVSLGDYWLAPAIQQKLIQPLDPQQLSHWSAVPPRWQALVRRDRNGLLSPSGEVWGAPYRWGMTLIAYRPDKFKALGWTPTDWSDLWRPELKGQFSLPDQAREVIGLTLKTLGQSYNVENPAQIKALAPQLRVLNQQVKFYDSTHYLEPLVMGDTWAAVGWSTDILPLLDQETELAVIAPASGTSLWADVWVQAANAKISNSADLNTWINFWWQDEVAEAISRFTEGFSPLLQDFSTQKGVLATLLTGNSTFEKSELLTPLSVSAEQEFQALWQQMRT
ncbi:MAG: extracellular solute-binding protein [Thermosynechococcaceae cyanobacterium]